MKNLLPFVLCPAAPDNNNSVGKPASKLIGDKQLSNRAEVEAIVLKFVEALNIDDASVVPLAKDVEYYGMFSQIPTCGESDVREYIDQIAPFMVNEEYGKMIIEGDSVAVVESVKAASDVYAPLAGKVSAANDDLEGCPEKINSAPYKEGWILKLSGIASANKDSLMNATEYTDFLENGPA